MGMFTPAMLPVLSGLARGFAVCDQWFSSVPTETLPNRAFACAGTSQGHMDDKTKTYTAPSIFGLLTNKKLDWRIYGYNAEPLTRLNFPDTTNRLQSAEEFDALRPHVDSQDGRAALGTASTHGT